MATPIAHRSSTRRKGRLFLRGFTLLELMTVVVLVAVLAMVAVPVAIRAVREGRSAKAAQQVALLYQVARGRAIGRSVAVLVRYSDGVWEVREAVTEDATSITPASNCSVPSHQWADATMNVLVDRFELVGQRPYQLVATEFSVVEVDDKGNAKTATLGPGATADVCFSPGGTMLFRQAGGAFSVAPRTLAIRVMQQDSALSLSQTGLARTVFILPNGVARVVAQAGVK